MPRDIGDPLEEVARTGKIGKRSQTPKSANIQTSEMLNTQKVEPLDFQTSNKPDTQQMNTPDIQDSELSKVQTVEHSTVQTSEIVKGQNMNSLAVQEEKKHKGRTQKTVYLPPALAKRLNFAAVEEEREISEIVADALEDYFKNKARETN
jgi:hypothetical protein